jgi:hypothetical protein
MDKPMISEMIALQVERIFESPFVFLVLQAVRNGCRKVGGSIGKVGWNDNDGADGERFIGGGRLSRNIRWMAATPLSTHSGRLPQSRSLPLGESF